MADRTFDAAEFVREFNEAGCTIELMQVDAQGLQGFCIKSGRNYSITMLKWADALDDCPDYYEQIVELLQQEAAAHG